MSQPIADEACREEELLQAAAASLDAVNALDQLEEPVVIFDKDWCYQFVNKAGWEALGRPRSEILGKNVWRLFPHLKHTEYKKAALEAMREQRFIEIEEYYPHQRLWFRTKFYPSKDSLVAFMQDITDLVEMRK